MIPINLPGVKPNLYAIEPDGRIWSNYKHDYLIPSVDKDGYLKIALSGGDRNHKRYFRIATLVALIFLEPPSNSLKDPTINHIDGNILNNHYTNLEWIERGTNASIRFNRGEGSNNSSAKLTEDQVIEICELLVDTNLSYDEICAQYGIGKSTLSSIKNQRSWKNITSNYDFNCRVTTRNAQGQFESINTKFINTRGV